MGIGFNALAVENGGGRSASLAFVGANQCPQSGIERLPCIGKRPLPEDMVNGFPRRKAHGQQTPLDAALEDIQDGVEDATTVGGRASSFLGCGQHRLKQIPLRVGEAGVVGGEFHRLDLAAQKMD